MKRLIALLSAALMLALLCLPAAAYDTDYTNYSEPTVKKTLTQAASYEILTDSLIYSKDMDTAFTITGGIVRLMTAYTTLSAMQEGGGSVTDLTDSQLEIALASFLINGDGAYGQQLVFAAARTEEDFVALMNSKADALGMKRTNYTNSTGEFDTEQTSSVSDLLILLQSVYERDLLKSVLGSNLYYTSDKTVSFTRSIPLMDSGNKDAYNKNAVFFICSDNIDTGLVTLSAFCTAAGRQILCVTREGNGNLTSFAANYVSDINSIAKNALTSYYSADLNVIGKALVSELSFTLEDNSTVYVAMQTADGEKTRVTLPLDYGMLVVGSLDECSITPVSDELPASAELNTILTRAELKYKDDVLLKVDLRVIRIVTEDGRQFSADYVLYDINSGTEQAQRQYKKNDWVIAVGIVIGVAVVSIVIAELLRKKLA